MSESFLTSPQPWWLAPLSICCVIVQAGNLGSTWTLLSLILHMRSTARCCELYFLNVSWACSFLLSSCLVSVSSFLLSDPVPYHQPDWSFKNAHATLSLPFKGLQLIPNVLKINSIDIAPKAFHDPTAYFFTFISLHVFHIMTRWDECLELFPSPFAGFKLYYYLSRSRWVRGIHIWPTSSLVCSSICFELNSVTLALWLGLFLFCLEPPMSTFSGIVTSSNHSIPNNVTKRVLAF
jgi:hypothetical protein